MTHPAPVPATPPQPFVDDSDFTLHVGSALDVLRTLPDESVHTVVTSPPYWGLRDYGTGSWAGGDPDCDHITFGGGPPESSTLDGAKQRGRSDPGRLVCPKCGATRTDQQLGLEKSPEEYVARMVEVLREVRRVLRRDGTCWLNLGDSYNAYNGNAKMGGPVSLTQSAERPSLPTGYGLTAKELKPKDLVGIPWRVAFALQQPYYAGRIKDERDRIWLAAMIDAEGCIHIHRRKAGTDSGAKFTKKDGTKVSYARTQDTYGVMVSIANTSEAIIDRAQAIIGQGSRYAAEAGTGKQQRKQTLHNLTLTGQQSRELLRELYPHLIAKQHEARIAYHSPASGQDAAACHEAIKSLHNGLETPVDKPAPPTLFEPGWYLRSEVIWGKSNPMPESVTDRPTKSHEQVFLLTRSPRYYFDQEAIREPHTPDGRTKTIHAHAVDNSHENYANMGTDQERWPNSGRNARSVWTIATQPYAEAHFATFPEELPRRCIAAGTSERGCCPECGAPWEREIEVIPASDELRSHGTNPGSKHLQSSVSGLNSGTSEQYHANRRRSETLGWRPSCDHTELGTGDGVSVTSKLLLRPVPCTVLDPFMGSGTVALVARKLGRRSIGIELNPDYAQLAARRLQQLSLLA